MTIFIWLMLHAPVTVVVAHVGLIALKITAVLLALSWNWIVS